MTAKLNRLVIAGAVSILALSVSVSAMAQTATSTAIPKHAPYGWADVAKWPDFTTGDWDTGAPPPPPSGGSGPPPPPPGGGGGPGGGPGGDNFVLRGAPASAAYMTAAAKDIADRKAGISSCEPTGVVSSSGSKFFFGKDVIVIGGLDDYYNVWRRVYMNLADHGDPEPNYFGHSIGWWEGETLVIDTVGISADSHLVHGLHLGSYATHVVERIRLTGPDTLEIKKVVTNPEILTKPWETTKTLTRTRDFEFAESYCWTDRDESAGPVVDQPR